MAWARARVARARAPVAGARTALVHQHAVDELPGSLQGADKIFCYDLDLDWDASAVLAPLGDKVTVGNVLSELVAAIAAAARPGDSILVMSNGGFGGIHDQLLKRLVK